jgi:hypothetical protein
LGAASGKRELREEVPFMSKAIDYMTRFLPISWDYENQTYRASVKKYLIAKRDTEEHADRITGAEKARKRLEEEIKRELGAALVPSSFKIHGMTFNASDLEASFRGKGSPAMLKRVLLLATHFQFIRQPNPKVPKHHPYPPTDAQTFADWYLGTDCSGFVNNFLGHSYGSQIEIKQYDADPTSRRKKPADIQPGDILISWAPKNVYGHIGIVEKTTQDTKVFRVWCVESLGSNGIGVTDSNIRLIESAGVADDPGGFYSVKEKDQGFRYYFQPGPGSFTPVS